MRDIEFHNNNAIVNVDDVAFTFETAENPREFDKYRTPQETLDWTNQEYQIGNYRVFPYGSNNDMPKVIKDVVQSNSISPGMLTKKGQLLWGKGPQLYREVLKDNRLVREWVQDSAVQNWLESWDYLSYLEKTKEDYTYIQGCFTKFYLARGVRISKPSIAKLEHISPEEARLATDRNITDYKPKYCIITDWNFKRVASVTDYDVYALFDFLKPFEHRNAILYSNKYSFCSDYYTVPDLYGSLEWIRRSSAIPIILKALSKNSINLKYHVISPAKFWEQAKKELEDKAKDENREYNASELINYKKNYLRQISKVLSGDDNTGKFWHSIKYLEIEGHKLIEEGWEIKEIKQNIKDFVAAQILISDQANRMVAGGVGLHAALGGAGESGRADSGSEQLYALKNYLQTGIDIPEAIVMKAVNYALKINFPSKGLKLGFYHDIPEKEEDVTSSKRIKNN